MSISRDRILGRIRKTLNNQPAKSNPVDYSSLDLFVPVDDDLLACFKKEAESVGAKVIISENQEDFEASLNRLMDEMKIDKISVTDEGLITILNDSKLTIQLDGFNLGMQAGMTRCDFLVARTGTVILSTAKGSGRRMSVFPPVHIIIASSSQLVPYLENALDEIKKISPEALPSQITHITGPSRTADIEKTLVLGAHGPKDLIIFVKK